MAEKHQDMPKTPVMNVDSKVVKTGGWRTFRPVLDEEKCIACYICWKFCPDVSVHISEGHPVIDLDHCKGCGICAKECPKKCIEMVLEVEG